MDKKDIVQAIQRQNVRISDHARDEAKEDSLLLNEIFYSVYEGAIIENYPDDRPYPSCLISGFTQNRKPVHSVWAYNSETQKAVLITVYIPDPTRWINFKKRRSI